jgi:hypothetical protein
MLNCQKDNLEASDADFDMLCDIQEKLKLLPINVNFKWIKGHQDSGTPTQLLDVWAQRNILVDSMAKLHMQQSCDLEPNIRLKYEGWSVHIGSVKLSRINVKEVYQMITKDSARRYWKTKLEITEKAEKFINWEILGKAFKSLTFAKKRRLIKLITNKAPTGNNMLKWQFWDNDKCPGCGQSENANHVMTCNAAGHNERLLMNIQQLKLWLVKINTEQSIVHYLITTLSSFATSLPINPVVTAPTSEATSEQNDIGHVNCFYGLLSNRWQNLQQSHYTTIKSKSRSTTWLYLVIKKLWDITSDMWDYRNSVLHRQTTSLHYVQQRQELIQDIKNYMSLIPKSMISQQLHYKKLEKVGTIELKTQELKKYKQVLASLHASMSARDPVAQAQQQFMITWLRNV